MTFHSKFKEVYSVNDRKYQGCVYRLSDSGLYQWSALKAPTPPGNLPENGSFKSEDEATKWVKGFIKGGPLKWKGIRSPFVTRAQTRKVLEKFRLSPDGSATYLQFRRRFKICGTSSDMYLFGPWCGMMLGIESDGYSHT